ncbi:CST complex subunit STN1 isoform X1 [Turdus rufiventris]|nr:CST complex subunit STN1 isoform X1 [Turdus rufiventris]
MDCWGICEQLFTFVENNSRSFCVHRFWMQSESEKYEEETPSLHWGLDPVFSAFARLYIKDIAEMRESKQVPGIFFYNGHPIRQVDVVGIVVQTKEKDAFYSYGVDDSTGVINCVCWKNPTVAETPLSDKVDDPVFDVQISRMLELPCLYREVYDKPFKSPEEIQSGLEGQNSSIHMLHEKVQGFLLENKIQTFYQQELETVDSLVSLADVNLPSASCQEVTDHDKELFKVTLDVIKEDCRKPRHAEKGCHFLHVLSCVRQSYNPSLAEVVMRRVLELLESNSDVVSTMEGYFMTRILKISYCFAVSVASYMTNGKTN